MQADIPKNVMPFFIFHFRNTPSIFFFDPRILTFPHSSKFTLSASKKSHFNPEFFSLSHFYLFPLLVLSWNPYNRIPSHSKNSPFPLLYSLMNLLQDLAYEEKKDVL